PLLGCAHHGAPPLQPHLHPWRDQVKLATLRAEATPGSSTIAVRIDGDNAVEIDGFADVGALIATEGWHDIAAAASGASHALADIEPKRWEAVVPKPGKIVCVGLNYATHIKEMGRELPIHPTLFAKF